MADLHILPIMVAGVAALVLSFTYYAVFGYRLTGAGGDTVDVRPPAWKFAAELGRSLLLATVVAGLATAADVTDVGGGIVLGLVLWLGFPLVLWTGAMLWEPTPWRTAVGHGGDWLIKLIVVAGIVSVWQP